MTGQATATSSTFSAPLSYRLGSPRFATLLGLGLSAAFFMVLFALKFIGILAGLTSAMDRYFLGHPISVAATIMFFSAMGILLVKQLAVSSETKRIRGILDSHLAPAKSKTRSEHSFDSDQPAEQWRSKQDASFVAQRWLDELSLLPSLTRNTWLVRRLSETLTRQLQRGSSKELADDLREISGRDADAAHDSYGMIRIIIWAIPMLGFLGTVIGITQTLGGLDFSSGTTAVENLKAGLYVAFDTTALGLVMSVVAIFLQFPVERSEQSLLALVDARVGAIVSTHLPSDEASDDSTAMIVSLCEGVQAAVAESLQRQTELWRSTIDETRSRWQAVHDDNNNQLVEAFKISLVPALLEHAESIRNTHQQFESIRKIEGTLQKNLQVLSTTHVAIQRNMERHQQIDETSETSMADAIRTLARAMDTMNRHLSTPSDSRRPLGRAA